MVSAVSPLDHCPQADQDLALELDPLVTAPLAELDSPPSALLAHQEALVPAQLSDLVTLVPASEVHSPASFLDKEHKAAVLDQVVHLEATASAQEA